MTAKLRIFVSSVQKELEDERAIVQNLVNTDAFLSAHCVPVLYEFEPASPTAALEGCLKALDACDVYVLIVGVEYGTLVGDVSITRAEYRRAMERSLPVLAFIRGDRGLEREEGTQDLLAELETDGPKYKRFGNVVELQKEVRAALAQLLQERFGITPTSDENVIAEQTIEATSAFESQRLDRLRWQDLDHDVARRLIAVADGRDERGLSEEELLAGVSARGSSQRIPRWCSRSVAFSPTPTAAPSLTATRAITKTSERPCLSPSIARLPSSTEIRAIPCASSGSIVCGSTSIRWMACVRRW